MFRTACFSLVMLVAGTSHASVVSYTIQDIGDFPDYTTPNIGQSYNGTGFVGLYDTEASQIYGNGDPSFAHLFGVENDTFSRTALQVAIGDLAGKTINSALLSFELLDGSGFPQDVVVTSFTADGSLGWEWDPPDNLGQATYPSTASFPGGDPADGHNEFDVTSFVQERATAGAAWLGLHLRGTDSFEYTYTSDENFRDADSALVRLIVDYEDSVAGVPEPSSMALLGLGVIGAGFRMRRRKTNATV